MQKHCAEKDEQLKQAETDYRSIYNSWENQCHELKFANKMKDDVLDKNKGQEEKLEKNDERIQELEKEKEEAIALYNVEQCKSVHY